MLLTTSQVKDVFTTHQEKAFAILSKLPEPNTLKDCEYTDNILALIYKNILDADPHPIIFNVPFSLCLDDPSLEGTARNIAEFKKILPLYLTYKDVGYANLQLLEDVDLAESNDLLVFKLLGNVRTALACGDSINEGMSNTIYSALFLYLMNLEKQQQLDNEHVKSLAQYASQLCSVYLHPEGASLLLARREGIACSIDPTNALRENVLELLSKNSIIDSLAEDVYLAQNAELRILDNISEEEARLKRIEERRQLLKKHSTEIIYDMNSQIADAQS